MAPARLLQIPLEGFTISCSGNKRALISIIIKAVLMVKRLQNPAKIFGLLRPRLLRGRGRQFDADNSPFYSCKKNPCSSEIAIFDRLSICLRSIHSRPGREECHVI